MANPGTKEYDDRTVAAVDMIGRLGSQGVEIRYSEPELKDSPLVWMAIASFPGHDPQVSAGLHPVAALEKLLEQLVDGGECQHCHKMTALVTDPTEAGPFPDLVCSYQYDPELKTYRRSCEGE